MRIAFVWTGFTSYMADCWRRLAAEPEVSLKVWIDAALTDFDADGLMCGIDWARADAASPDALAVWRPDVVFAVGWHSAICRAVVSDPRLTDIPKVCCFDMPWRRKLRCFVAPFVLGRFLRRYEAAFVPGAACVRYARWLGFRRVYAGLFAIDTTRFAAEEARRPGQYLLYIGRNVPEKRLGDLCAAHRLYRAQGGMLPLKMYGPGLPNGFARPEDVPELLHGAAAFVLASDFDPWPLVLLEAMAAGCPVIASDRCTNRYELGKNWSVFTCGDVAGLARAMATVTDNSERRRENAALARQYDCGEWVRRVMRLVGEVTV